MSIEMTNESGQACDELQLQRLARFVLDCLHVHPDSDLGVMLVNEEAIERLHLQWMDEPGPTDVLSFPMDELRPGRFDAPSAQGLLGDVVICPQVASLQADAAGVTFQQEVNMLLTHGVLHLLGFDHATPDEEAEMFSLQRDLLSRFERGDRSS